MDIKFNDQAFKIKFNTIKLMSNIETLYSEANKCFEENDYKVICLLIIRLHMIFIYYVIYKY